jgi:hypothetical protein
MGAGGLGDVRRLSMTTVASSDVTFIGGEGGWILVIGRYACAVGRLFTLEMLTGIACVDAPASQLPDNCSPLDVMEIVSAEYWFSRELVLRRRCVADGTRTAGSSKVRKVLFSVLNVQATLPHPVTSMGPPIPLVLLCGGGRSFPTKSSLLGVTHTEAPESQMIGYAGSGSVDVADRKRWSSANSAIDVAMVVVTL